MNWICYLVDQIARFWGGNDSSFVNFQSNLNNPPLKNVDGIKGRLFIIALFSIHSELLTKEDAVKVLQVVDDAVASEFVKKIMAQWLALLEWACRSPMSNRLQLQLNELMEIGRGMNCLKN